MSRDSLVVQMGDIIKEVSDNVEDSIDIALQKVPKNAVRKLKSVSPKGRRGKYANGWTSRKLDDKTVVVYNSKIPGFTHLLENGHAIVNANGEYGRTNGKPHIAPVEEETVQEFIDELMKAQL